MLNRERDSSSDFRIQSGFKLPRRAVGDASSVAVAVARDSVYGVTEGSGGVYGVSGNGLDGRDNGGGACAGFFG